MSTNDELLTEKVTRIIDEKIRPALHTHGGDIVLVKVKERNVKVRFLGACSSCPSMQNTMDEIVTESLREELGNEIGRIILWNSVSDELIDYARNYLKNKQKQQ